MGGCSGFGVLVSSAIIAFHPLQAHLSEIRLLLILLDEAGGQRVTILLHELALREV
jgi:hypothetical protein